MKKARMKETVFIFMVFCFLGGCTEKAGQKNTVKTKSKGFRGFPVELNVSSDEGMPVKISAGKGTPLKVQLQENVGKPLEVELNGAKALPVNLGMQENKHLPVEVSLPRAALVYIAIATGTILTVTILTCLAVISTARSARAVCRSADAIKKNLANK
jgi:hypothetical protein